MIILYFCWEKHPPPPFQPKSGFFSYRCLFFIFLYGRILLVGHRLAYKDSKSTFEELLDLDKSFTIHHRNLQKLVTEIFKVKNNLSPSFMKSIFPDSHNPYNLRNGPEFKTSNVHTVSHGTETIGFRGPKTWFGKSWQH